jgi:hypothetical protein
MKIKFLSIILLLIIFSCKKNPTITVTDDSWKRVSFVKGSGISCLTSEVGNTFAGKDYLFVYSNYNNIYTIADTNNLVSWCVANTVVPYDYVPKMNSSLMIETNLIDNVIFKYIDEHCSDNRFFLQLDSLIENFERIMYLGDLNNNDNRKTIALNENNSALIAYKTKSDNTNINGQMGFLLLNLKQRESFNFRPDTLNSIIIEVPETGGISSNVVNIIPLADKFIVSLLYSNRTYYIYTDGTYRVIDGIKFMQVFDYNEGLFALDSEMNLHFSTNNGETWTPKYSLTGTLNGYNILGYNFQTIDQRIICYTLDNIFELKLSNNNNEFVELDNRSIIGNKITSIIDYNNIIYMTTLGGLYYKEKAKLFIEK